jgi:hypothetical protein
MMIRRFPIQGGHPVRWAIAEQAYARYASFFGKDQSIERMAERGGFGVLELDFFLSQHTNVYLLMENKWPPEDEPWDRAGGDCICHQCGEKYFDHPEHPKIICLTRLCTGKLVKL